MDSHMRKTPSVNSRSDNETVVIDTEESQYNPYQSGQKNEYDEGKMEENMVDEDKFEIDESDVLSSDKGHGNIDPGSDAVVTLPFKQLMVVFVGLMLGIFLSSLDQTIVSVITTKIANEFQGLNQIPWIGTSYLLTTTTFQPLYGKASDIFGRKETFLFAIGVFLIGSALCGAAQSTIMIIIARGIAGIGTAGIMSMVMIIITDLVSHRDRGKYQGIIGACFGLSSVIGPLLGGVFADKASWRWAFFINLPIGAITIAAVIKLLHLPHTKGSFKEKLQRIDVFGSLSLIIAIVLILLPLNWGGSTYAWSSPIVIGLFCAGAVALMIFLFIEWKIAKEPIIPFRMFKSRTNTAVFLTCFFIGMGFFGIMFYMPLFFLIVHQKSATKAGLEMLPLIIGLLVAAVSSGFMVSKYGQYLPYIWIGLALSTAGTGLLSLLTEDSSRGEVAGFLFIDGFGLGFCIQTTVLAIQSSVERKDIAIVTSNASFFRTVGTVLGVAITGTVFNNALKKNLGSLILENPQIAAVISDSYLASSFGPAIEVQILHAYMLSLKTVFRACVPFTGLGFFFSLFIKRQKLPKTLEPVALE
ncbi:hypothetical protein BGZ80_005275 [Entomortierella chlamydospora]|uniref:Major facilitator superfamily (MFS) profile domain-containing protein n=1 Tax=Entomortierella chlamydospora TaxID=101097 RepID=A0A9P6SVE4_9FUNG|nr:hypothetical protein BGZ80_005275 [Entomortierella chlamydospora]